ncbi:MAG: peptidase dimerization domain-containing protein [Candidatus Peribacteria bacterium]|nr:peptidase dimerization domain-containing protein [Candidatus Peribacteria bacterium]
MAEHKGQFMIYLTTILHLIENNKLGYNITLLIDGTQNKVGTDIIPFIENNKAELYADFCFFSTGHGIQDKATIEVGQRGSINFDIVLSNPPLEGGQRGGGTEQIINPNLEMSKILNRMYNGNKIAIPYFYYNVEKTKQEVEIKRYGTNLEYKTITKANNKNYTILEPTLEITGIISLPKFEKSNVFPKKTIANLHMNIVNNQNYQEIINGIQQRLKYNIPKNLKTELIIHEAYNPCKYHSQNLHLQKATALLTGAYKSPAEYQQKPHGIKIAQTIQTSICEYIIAIPFAHQESNI